MIKYLFLIYAVLVTTLTFAQDVKFSLVVNQGGKKVHSEDQVCLLERKPFVLQMAARNVEGFLVGATFDRDVYMSAIGEVDLEVSWFVEMGMSEELFNVEQMYIDFK